MQIFGHKEWPKGNQSHEELNVLYNNKSQVKLDKKEKLLKEGEQHIGFFTDLCRVGIVFH